MATAGDCSRANEGALMRAHPHPPGAAPVPTQPGRAPASSIVLDFADLTRPGGTVHVTRAAADAVSKEGKGTKEVEVPLEVIPDLPPQRSGATTAPPLARWTSAVPSSPTGEEERPEELTDEELADEVLARRAALGDQQSFTVLVDRHGPALHRHVSRMLADPGVVEDVLQESLLCAWRGLPGFRGEAGVRTWLFAIARRQVFAVSRRSSLTPSPAPANPAGVAGEVVAGRVVAGQVTASGDPAEISVECAFVQAIEAALQLLPEKQRSAWLLKEVEGMTYSEIATVLEVGPGAVRGLLARARATLSAALQGWR